MNWEERNINEQNDWIISNQPLRTTKERHDRYNADEWIDQTTTAILLELIYQKKKRIQENIILCRK